METAQQSEQMVPIISHAEQLLHLQYYAERPPTEQARLDKLAERYNGVAPATPQPLKTMTILPGLNYERMSDIKAAQVPASSNARFSIKDPTHLSLWEKRELVANTTNREALTRWRVSEGEREIVALIDAKLSKGA